MKKRISIAILGLLFMGLLAGFTSAGPLDSVIAGIQDGGKGVYELFRPLLEGIVGEAENGETFLAKILFLVIIFTVLFVSLGNIEFFSEKVWPLWLVSISASIISIRWFGNSEIVQTAILPYSALGITVSAGLPFILYFLIVEKIQSRISRKLAWIFFSVVFIGLYFSRWDELGNFGYIYLVTSALGIVSFLMDGTIQKFFSRSKIERGLKVQDARQVQSLRGQLDRVSERYAKDGQNYMGLNGKNGHEGYEKDKETILKQIDTFIKN
jgi:hypothetical protein